MRLIGIRRPDDFRLIGRWQSRRRRPTVKSNGAFHTPSAISPAFAGSPPGGKSETVSPHTLPKFANPENDHAHRHPNRHPPRFCGVGACFSHAPRPPGRTWRRAFSFCAPASGGKTGESVNFLKIRRAAIDGHGKSRYYVNCKIRRDQEDCHGYETLPHLWGEILRYL